MKIGLLCPYSVIRPGGVQEHVAATKEILKRRGHDVRIITPLPRSEDTNGATFDDDTIFLGSSKEVKFKAPFNTTADLSATADTLEITSMLEAEKFDIIHVHEPWMPILGSQVLLKSDAVNVGTLHAILPKSAINKTIEKARIPYVKSALKRLDMLTAVSEVAASNVYDVDPAYEVKIVPNGIMLDKYTKNFKKLPEYSDDIKTILFLNRLEKRKGPLELLRAYRILAQERDDIRLVIAGDGPKKRSLQTYVKRYNLPNVEFLGFVDDRTKKRLFKTCDVYCSPALYGESFGIVLLEAMAIGAPIVAGDNAGYSSVMKERGSLSLVDPENSQEMARRIELMIDDAQISKLCSSWGKEYVKQFSYERIVDQYEKLYEELMKR